MYKEIPKDLKNLNLFLQDIYSLKENKIYDRLTMMENLAKIWNTDLDEVGYVFLHPYISSILTRESLYKKIQNIKNSFEPWENIPEESYLEILKCENMIDIFDMEIIRQKKRLK
jgi:hypothetical protein